jgi:hypothetical protein
MSRRSVRGGQEAQSRNPGTQGYPLFVIEPYAEDEDAWAAEELSQARGLARGKLYTPSYMNAEGLFDQMQPEKALQAAWAFIWGTGVKNFVGFLEKWREGIVNNVWVSWKMMSVRVMWGEPRKSVSFEAPVRKNSSLCERKHV